MIRARMGLLVVGLAVALIVWSGPAAAARLYSIDALGQTLVTLDTETGAVTVVGHISGLGLAAFDLTWYDGRLYALSPFGAVHVLHTIDPASGARLDTVTVQLDGAPIGRATGLTTRNGHLLIGFTPDSKGQRASHLGRLNADGTISDVVDFSTLDADFHGLATAPDGATLFSIDSGFTNDLYRTTTDPSTHEFVGGGDFQGVNDLVFRRGDLWGLSSVAQDFSDLWRLDPATGAVLARTPIDVFPGQSLFVGLAHVPCPADLDGDDDVAFGDLLDLLAAWGPCPDCPEDLDSDSVVGFSDLLLLLSVWGPC